MVSVWGSRAVRAGATVLAAGLSVLGCAGSAWAKASVSVSAPAQVKAHHTYWVSADGNDDASEATMTCLYEQQRVHTRKGLRWHWVVLACAAPDEVTGSASATVSVPVVAGARGTRQVFQARLIDMTTHHVTDTSTVDGQPATVVRAR